GGRAKVTDVVPVDGVYEDFAGDETVRLQTLGGVNEAEGVMIVKSADGATLVFNDVLFNSPHGRGVMGFIFRYLTQSTGGPRVSRVVRWFVMKDRELLRTSLERLADTTVLKRIIVSHHRMITDDPAGTLRAVAARL
ncbi:MAG: hypothetical protein JRI68_30405, partial [Deltaproteobacteria bacterium]|nr:hypothetical protein [Deltaproteobacteria bacterium]